MQKSLSSEFMKPEIRRKLFVVSVKQMIQLFQHRGKLAFWYTNFAIFCDKYTLWLHAELKWKYL